ncbi:hypothetical protein [Fibrivirga algicola]|uniref:Uncharacterized protein n=1 Tax=Fibrivirga algicola TaxID=2950420 RepID=A0ABX0QBW5_9BACT|nr:hypothetical protein [Fibrivirga algicola]NID09398.1 hypothetical protein [Fibrivirga algicola]
MITETITAINAALDNYPGPLHNLDGRPSRLLGLCRPVFSQEENRTTLITSEGETVTDDDSLGWLSCHTTQGANVTSYEQFGSFQRPYYDYIMRIILLSRDPSVMGRLMLVLPTVRDVRVVGRIDDNASDVMRRFLGWPADKAKSLDPGLYAYSMQYAIEGVSHEDLTAFYQELKPQDRRYAPQL